MKFHRLSPSAISLAVACLLCAVLAYFFSRPQKQADSSESTTSATARVFVFSIFNTHAYITLYDPPGSHVNQAVKEIFDELTALHATINVFDASSELSKLNATAHAHPFACSPRLWDILLQAEQAWQLSDHLFDATVGPLLKLWGFRAKQGHFPQEQEIADAKRLVGFDQLLLNREQRTVQFPRQGMSLDFGGIAKGYALQLAITIAQRHGLQAFVIDLGGNIYCSKVHVPPLDNYHIGIRNPRQHDETVATVILSGQCIATSGNYERFRTIAGKRIGHIMDPRTGCPSAPPQAYEGVTVITNDPTLSDVFSTTAFVGGPEIASRLAAKIPGTSFVFVSFDAQEQPQTLHVPQASSHGQQ